MTTYTAIPDSDIDPESPGTTTLFTRLRDNPLAIAEGDATAPDIAYSALGPPTVTSGTTYTLAVFDDGLLVLDDSWTKKIEWVVSLSGQINFFFEGTSYSGSRYLQGRIYVNDIAVGTTRLWYGTQSYNETISVSEGDAVQLYMRREPGFSGTLNEARIEIGNLLPGHIERTL